MVVDRWWAEDRGGRCGKMSREQRQPLVEEENGLAIGCSGEKEVAHSSSGYFTAVAVAPR